MTGTYRRSDTGDRLCPPEVVRGMLAEQVEDSRDNRILRGFGTHDLSSESVRAYRQAMRDRLPTHPFLDFDDLEFLRRVSAHRRDRETGEEGLTAVGLLMFGLAENIRDEFPNYHLDYQERPRSIAEARWIDRLTLDGTWSGNLFDFYRRVSRKLAADLKVPFALHGGQRQDETPVHEALREALVNTLVHADYTSRASVLVVTGDPATLRDVPRAWVALDLDGMPLPAGCDPRDLAACGEVARGALPAAFRGAGCLIAATASHGIKPGARLRLTSQVRGKGHVPGHSPAECLPM